MTAKKATVVESKRGGIESWDCSACGYFTHGDATMVEDHIAATHGSKAAPAPEQPDEPEEKENPE